MPNLNDSEFTMRLRRGTRTNLVKTTTLFYEGEPSFTTDTKQVFVGDSTYKAIPVQTLDMAVVDRASGEVCVERANGTIIYKY